MTDATPMVVTHDDLLSADAVRTQSARVTQYVREGRGLFVVHDDRLEACAALVAATTRRRYPTLDIPYHSRWRHFSTSEAVALESQLTQLLAELDPGEAARVGFDLVIPSVLLDAGAGAAWRFQPPDEARPVGRSEGLGLASLQMFLDGTFANAVSTGGSASPQTEGTTLAALPIEALESGFQVSDDNPVLGLEGRLQLLRRLGETIVDHPQLFPSGRPGDLATRLIDEAQGPVSARSILELVLDALGPIWPTREADITSERPLGDAWIYPPFGQGPSAIIPFHKLSQWLSYSLAETLERSGIPVNDLDVLTALPEYRNGGLLYETGVIALTDPRQTSVAHRPESQTVVEWRSLTITLLDEIADLVRTELHRPNLLLAEILEGGTWAAGRALAFERDPAGTPPLHLDSDGTVF